MAWSGSSWAWRCCSTSSPTAWAAACPGASPGTGSRPTASGQDARLLDGELLLGQHARVPELSELLELLKRVGGLSGRRGRRRRRLRVGLLRLVLRGPAVGLAPRDAVADAGGGAGDDGGAGDP